MTYSIICNKCGWGYIGYTDTDPTPADAPDYLSGLAQLAQHCLGRHDGKIDAEIVTKSQREKITGRSD